MSLFRCSDCGCCENTALAQYWYRKAVGGAAVCSACDPEVGGWHGQFEQRSAKGMLVSTGGRLWHPRQLMAIPKDLEIIGIVQEQGRWPLQDTAGLRQGSFLPQYRPQAAATPQ